MGFTLFCQNTLAPELGQLRQRFQIETICAPACGATVPPVVAEALGFVRSFVRGCVGVRVCGCVGVCVCVCVCVSLRLRVRLPVRVRECTCVSARPCPRARPLKSSLPGCSDPGVQSVLAYNSSRSQDPTFSSRIGACWFQIALKPKTRARGSRFRLP